MDMITCGSCTAEFSLTNISDFIQHRAYDCRPESPRIDTPAREQQVLVCSSCNDQFRTSWGLLQHAQDTHNRQLFSWGVLYETEPGQNVCRGDGVGMGEAPRGMVPSGGRSWGLDRHTGDHVVCLRLDPSSPGSPSSRRHILKDSSPTDTTTCSRMFPNHSITDKAPRGSPVPQNDDPQVMPLDLKISLREKVSLYTETPSDSENSSASSVEVSACSNGCLLPKKRKWSILPPSSDDCASPDTVMASFSPCRPYELPPEEVSSSTPPARKCESSNHSAKHNMVFVPKWKYSMDLCSSVPIVTGRVNRQTNGQTPGICLTLNAHSENGLSGSSRISDTCHEHLPQQQTPLSSPLPPPLAEISGQSEENPSQYLQTPNPAGEKDYPVSQRLLSPAGHHESLDCQLDKPQNDNCHGVGKKRRYPTTRPFKCDHCEHSFNQRIHLKKHLSKHTGIKPFKCGLCDYSTVERSHLKVHLRIHTGEKPYKCSFCDYATAQNSTLKIHLKRHHGGRMLACRVCGKCFTQLAMLDSHMTSHMMSHTDSTTNHNQLTNNHERTDRYILDDQLV